MSYKICWHSSDVPSQMLEIMMPNMLIYVYMRVWCMVCVLGESLYVLPFLYIMTLNLKTDDVFQSSWNQHKLCSKIIFNLIYLPSRERDLHLENHSEKHLKRGSGNITEKKERIIPQKIYMNIVVQPKKSDFTSKTSQKNKFTRNH